SNRRLLAGQTRHFFLSGSICVRWQLRRRLGQSVLPLSQRPGERGRVWYGLRILLQCLGELLQLVSGALVLLLGVLKIPLTHRLLRGARRRGAVDVHFVARWQIQFF